MTVDGHEIAIYFLKSAPESSRQLMGHASASGSGSASGFSHLGLI